MKTTPAGKAPATLAASAPAAIETMPIYYSRDTMLFPGGEVSDTAGRPASLAALVELAAQRRTERLMFVAVQRDKTITAPTLPELHPVGVVAKVTRIAKRASDNIEVEMTGVVRARLIAIDTSQPSHVAKIIRIGGSGTLTDMRRQELAVWMQRDTRPFRGMTPPTRPARMSDSDFVDLVIENVFREILDSQGRAALLQEIDVDRRAGQLMSYVDATIAQLLK